jgi:defect in organelle trafficking protein DotB
MNMPATPSISPQLATQKNLVYWDIGIPMPPTFGLNSQEVFRQIMLFAHKNHVSDIFIQPDQPIVFSRHGKLTAITQKKLDLIEIWNLLYLITDRQTAKTDLLSGTPVNSSYVLQESDPKTASGYRRYYYRVNATAVQSLQSIDSAQIVMRAIPDDPPDIYKVGLPEEWMADLTPKTGIVYIAGATGSGKSTTFSAIIRYILEQETAIQGSIITYEAPIEFRFGHIPSRHSIITQSEVPRHVSSFYDGIKEAMRRKPELILIGELRDEETIQAAAEAALTGHAVFATVHANNVSNILMRLLYRLPESERTQGIYTLLDASRFLMAQRLLPGKNGGRVAVREILAITPDVLNELFAQKSIVDILQALKRLVVEKGISFSKDAKRLLDMDLLDQATYDAFLKQVY